MVVSVEEVSSSLVREYLSRKGLRKTIACMDEEHPRTEASINNRSLLRQILNIEDLYRKNKLQNSPLKTLLEIIVKDHIRDVKSDKITSNDDDHMQPPQAFSLTADNSAVEMRDTKPEEGVTAFASGQQIKLSSGAEDIPQSQPTYTSSLPKAFILSSHTSTGFQTSESEDKEILPLFSSLPETESSTRKEQEKKTTAESTQRIRKNRMRRGMMAGPVASTAQELNKKRQNRRQEGPQLLIRREETEGNGAFQTSLVSDLSEVSSAYPGNGLRELQSTSERSERCFENPGRDVLETKKVRSLPWTAVADLDVSEMVLDDIDDDDNMRELSKVSFQRTVTEHSFTACPMDLHTAMELKSVLLGSSLNCFSIEWRNQGFTFSETYDLRYGVVQRKGGPCGVLASVQAFVIKKLLFENSKSSNAGHQRLRPSNTTRRKGLISAAAEILWRAGDQNQAKLAINSGRNHFTPSGCYKSEGVLEKITCYTLDNFKDLLLLLEQHIEQFEMGPLGCMLLTISAVLSRSVEKVREDMDVSTTSLIGAHGYCTQELVNLLIYGRAVSNVFDNDMQLDSGNGNITLLKGIKGHCDVGLLSLFEHYNICKVGTYLKTPNYPIWVVCSESHFSVLFGLQRELLTYQDQGLEFDLYYYDGLANQNEEIRLTVSLGKLAQSESGQDVDTDLIPPLELCIRTRWKDAAVNWNDTEPIL
ncbi:probable ubiquitin carboxyl-terminal hydrolase MINDY-4 [Xyrichtys novacula]|uniref:Ubiquitin carboxyl-terminal hydrolase MINDY n=1 Tax=Xyrichtys novacula TaxID=13765 RepID=A0AAV1FIN6_XYRNO|nr:probable ubiquitin carboxyl-terminal hydrolase MINDY-4 [Xyrichtys novacula]